MSWLISNYTEILTAAVAVVGAATTITKLTPSKADDKAVGKIRKVLMFVSLRLRR